MEAELSFLSLFFKASFLVQLVMIGLLLSSIVSWAIIFNRNRCIDDRLTIFNKLQSLLHSEIELLSLYKKLSNQKNKIGIEAIFYKGLNEFSFLSKNHSFKNHVLIKEVQRSMIIALAKEREVLEKNLTTLATIQSISPYVGLFGTIWGIMNVFHQLGSNAGQATLAVVAPGISEALIATAMGLFAAIPAGIFYNKFISKIDGLTMGYQRFIEELVGIICKKIHVRH